ncbi:MAG TPA: aminotransferase class III-fold pyridoxal phosphate-dependent enzyme, partial [Geobacterales bacterium]|nr:aminotransferase class III-fold pyridoxal phosphate-dependent enzyme [Geobacterales bacterium]
MARGGGSGFGLQDLPRISHGKGSYLYDEAGKRYIDGSGGPAVFRVGHSHPEVNAAIARQMDAVAYGYRYLFTSSALEALSEMMLRISGNCFTDIV